MVRQWPLVAFRLGHFETFEGHVAESVTNWALACQKRAHWNLAFAQTGSVRNSFDTTAILASLRKVEFHDQLVWPPLFELVKQYEHEACGVHASQV